MSDEKDNDPNERASPYGHQTSEGYVWDAKFLQLLVDTAADPIFVKDEQHRWIYLNEMFCQKMGRPLEELLGKSDYDFFPPEQAAVFWARDDKVFQTEEPDENEESFTEASGQERIILTKKTLSYDAQGRRILVGVIRDITDRRRLEARLAMVERLISLGTLAGGIAHEVNNPLSFVLANIEYVMENLECPNERPEELKSALQAATQGAERVREVIRSLKSFSEFAGDDALTILDLRQSLRSTVDLMRNELRQRAEIVEHYDTVPLIDGNTRSLGQIFLNLLINAAHAIDLDDKKNHKITVHCHTDAGGNAVVEISDTGQGIADEIRHRIFHPFFTTKPVGQGTGLGLSICHTLVEAMTGQIEVESVPGAGSTFRVIFPPAATQALDDDDEDEDEDDSTDNEASQVHRSGLSGHLQAYSFR